MAIRRAGPGLTACGQRPAVVVAADRDPGPVEMLQQRHGEIAPQAGGIAERAHAERPALRQRDKTGEGCWIDVAMGENLFPFLYWALGNASALGRWPRAGGETVTGGTPRYNIYRTRDDRFIAAAPLEDKFWANFTRVVGLPAELCDDDKDPAATTGAVARLIAEKTADEWLAAFEGVDICCSLVRSLEEALADPHWNARGVFGRGLRMGGRTVPALPSVIAPCLRDDRAGDLAPGLGTSNDTLS